jgi:hypothetical protein
MTAHDDTSEGAASFRASNTIRGANVDVYRDALRNLVEAVGSCPDGDPLADALRYAREALSAP